MTDELIYFHLYHDFFAADSQLHNSTVSPEFFLALSCSFRDCIEDVVVWMSENKLKINDDKTAELIDIGTKSKLPLVTSTPMSISGCDIPFSQSARNLGFYLDETLSMDVHVNHSFRTLQFLSFTQNSHFSLH